MAKMDMGNGSGKHRVASGNSGLGNGGKKSKTQTFGFGNDVSKGRPAKGVGKKMSNCSGMK